MLLVHHINNKKPVKIKCFKVSNRYYYGNTPERISHRNC